MDVIVTGAAGLLGREAVHALADRGMRPHALGRTDLDVTDPDAVHSAFARIRPRAVVHCAALTDVDACERDPGRAQAVNAAAAGNVAAAAAAAGASVVGVSTDYVFDGTKGTAYVEGDAPNPIQAYGRSKLEGERLIREANPAHYVVRSAWIHGKGGKNFLSRVPRLAAEGTALRVVSDQVGSPTYAPDLAGAIADLLAAEPPFGTYHVVNGDACTFAEYCRHLLGSLGAQVGFAEVTRAELDLPAARPANTSLDCAAWRAAGLPPLRSWREATRDFLAEVPA